jgi:NAD(P)-dependent dehydrogenase (short-subunit alcohol dehydrogenase family)
MNGLFVVAGASGAIGRSLCQIILQRGGTPLLVGRNADKLSILNEELGGNCPMISGIDFSSPEEAGAKLAFDLKGEKLKGLAYAVGSITLKPLRGCKPSDFVDSYNLNVIGAAEIIKASLAGLKNGGSKDSTSSIVLFSSVAARCGLSNHAVVGASKAAVEGLTLSLAAELSPVIRVNCVAPSLTGGGSEMAKFMTENEKIAEAVAKAHPLPRLGDPVDSANAAAYLLSSDSAWTTGIILPVDGGRSSLLK